MPNVIKAEINKLLSGKAIYICLLILVMVPVGEFLITQGVVNSGGFNSEFNAEFSAYDASDVFVYLSMVLFNGGAICVSVAILMTFLFAEDYMKGTLKYIMVLSSRSKVTGAKLAMVVLIDTALTLVSVLTITLTAIAGRGLTFNNHSLLEMVMYIGIFWLSLLVFTSVVALANVLINNVPAAMAVGVGVYLLVWSVLGYMPEDIMKYNFMASVMAIGETDMSIVGELLVVPVIVGVLCFGGVAYKLWKREYLY